VLLGELLLLHDVELQIAESELAREAHLVGFRLCEAAQREQQGATEQHAQRQGFHRG
jgi:hypothetical protein